MSRVFAALLAASIATGCGSEPSRYPEAHDPATAPVASVDRFGSYATLFNRDEPVFHPEVSADLIPGPNEPIDFDAHFLTRALGPEGSAITYYGLDVAPAAVGRAFVVVGVDAARIPGQLPIVEARPGDDGYSDFVHLVEVHVGEDYAANAFTSAFDVKQAVARGVAVTLETGTVVNWPLVPAGSTATRTFAGEQVDGYTAWLDGEVVHHLQFDTELELTPDGKAPRSNVSVIFANDTDPSEGFATESDSAQTHNVVQTLPGDEAYSSLWFHQVGHLAGFADVKDWPSATDNFREVIPVEVNCPVVAP